MMLRHILLITIIVLVPVGTLAEEPAKPQTGYVGWLGAGALVVNGSVALANGFSLTNGSSSRTNGMFGVLLGSTTMAISAVSLAVADDDRSQNFSLLLGATGLASAVTGVLSIKFSAPNGDRISLSPLVNPFGSKDSAKAGLQLKVSF